MNTDFRNNNLTCFSESVDGQREVWRARDITTAAAQKGIDALDICNTDDVISLFNRDGIIEDTVRIIEKDTSLSDDEKEGLVQLLRRKDGSFIMLLIEDRMSGKGKFDRIAKDSDPFYKICEKVYHALAEGFRSLGVVAKGDWASGFISSAANKAVEERFGLTEGRSECHFVFNEFGGLEWNGGDPGNFPDMETLLPDFVSSTLDADWVVSVWNHGTESLQENPSRMSDYC